MDEKFSLIIRLALCLDSVRSREFDGEKCWCTGEFYGSDHAHNADCFAARATLKEAQAFIERLGDQEKGATK